MSDILSQILEGNTNGASIINKSAKERAATDLEFFARYYFPHYFSSEWSQFHYDMVNYIQDIFLNRRDQENKLVIAAPRGHAKSTIFTFLSIMWAVCYNYKKVIVVISATNNIAKKFITGCRVELETNELLKKDFYNNFDGGVLWSASEFCTKNDVYVCGRGAGEQMRGLRWKNSRPDCCLIDDLETMESVSTELQRSNLEEWFTGDVLPMGAPNCDYLYVGTIISYSALLHKLLHEPRYSSWRRRLYSAVIKDADNEKLWSEWENIFTDPKRGDKAYDDAYEFYVQHKKEMLKGVELLWENQRDDMYLFLRTKKIENESKYNSEYLNDPMTDSLRDFPEQWLLNNTYEDLPEITEVYGAVDPSLGKSRKSDTSAIIMLGRGVDNIVYVLDADIKRRKPDEIIQDMTYHIAKYYDKLKGFVVETNVMQEYFASNIKQKFLDLGYYINWIEVRSTGDKDVRIKSMIPKVKHGYIKFNKTHITLWNQLKNYPKSKDDGPDCLQMALSAIMPSSSSSFSFSKISTSSTQVKHKDQISDYIRQSLR